MKQPALSVIVPVYNGAASLGGLYKALCRVLEPVDFELIFVDDASQDDSAKLLEEMAAADHRVRVIPLHENKGQQEATCQGMAAAGGLYLANLDDDGQHPPAYLLPMLEHLKNHSLDIVYGLPQIRQQSPLRQGGSTLRNLLFYTMFPYSRGVEVSSFRVMTAELFQRVMAERGEFFYFSASVFQRPVRAENLPYPHLPRQKGRSGYGFGKLAVLYGRILWHYIIHPKPIKYQNQPLREEIPHG